MGVRGIDRSLVEWEMGVKDVQEMMAQRIRHAVLEVYEGVGHNMKVEIPDALAARTLRFVESIAGG